MKKRFKGFIYSIISIIFGASISLIGCGIQKKLIIEKFGYYIHNISIDHYSLILIEIGVIIMVSSVIIYSIYIMIDIMKKMKDL